MRDVVSASVHSITTAGEQHLYLDGVDADKIRGKHVCLLDDVISTGESLHALEALVKNAGAQVVKQAALLAEGDAADRGDILFLQKLPLFKKIAEGEYEHVLYAMNPTPPGSTRPGRRCFLLEAPRKNSPRPTGREGRGVL